MPISPPRIGLFVTCLVDLFRPTVGFAAVKLLEEAGCVVEVPTQTCCGQPAYNSGDRATARSLAQQVIAAFEPLDYVVAPSGSCAGMIKQHYPPLFSNDPGWRARAERLSAKTFELTSFLTDVLGVEQVNASHPGTVTYHDSCSGLRELGIKTQPRRLLGTVEGVELREMEESEVCCGFGGTFCVKYPEVVQPDGQRQGRSHPRHRRGYGAGRRSGLFAEHGRQTPARRRDECRFVMSLKCWPA
jgi:L-lactate dehydrogenase complex protein LldE